MTDKIMEYINKEFNCNFENSFVRHTFENMIDYAVNNFNNSKNQLAYYLSDIVDELTFNEIKQVIDNIESEANNR